MGLHDGHRQRKRQQFLSHGPESMADHELLELALFYAIPRRDTNETAHRLLDQFGSLDRVLSAPEQELEKVEGVGQGAAVLLRLMGSIGDRARRPGREEKIVASVDQAGPTSCGCWTGSGRSGCISCAWTPRERCCPAGCCPRGRRT